MWAEVDPTSGVKTRGIWLLFTGDEVPDGARYIGTAFFGVTGALVVHCYVR